MFCDVQIIEEAPLLQWLAATISSNGHKHSYLAKTGAPTVGYRTIGAGRAASHATRVKRETELKILSANSECDTREADIYQFGRAEYVRRDVRDHLVGAFAATEAQIINGSLNDGDGYTGFADTLDDSDDAMVVDAGGTGGGSLVTSVWLVRSTDDLSNVAIVGKGEGTNPENARIQIELGETMEQALQDGSGNNYPGLFTPCEGWLGVQVGSAYSFGRICNLTDEAGKGLTDALLSQLWQKVPASHRGSMDQWRFLVNPTAQGQLQRSRTATSESGKEADLPANWQGIPFILTDHIPTNETLLTAA